MKMMRKLRMLLAKEGKPRTIAEELILPAAKVIVSAMVGEKVAEVLNLVTLSNDTVNKQIHKISYNVKEHLIERTDFANKSHLLCYVKYEFEGKIIENVLFCR